MPFGQPPHDRLEDKIAVTLAHPSKILAIFVCKAVVDQGGNFVHALTVMLAWMVLQVDEDYTG